MAVRVPPCRIKNVWAANFEIRGIAGPRKGEWLAGLLTHIENIDIPTKKGLDMAMGLLGLESRRVRPNYHSEAPVSSCLASQDADPIV